MSALLAIEDLTILRGAEKALDRVSLTVARGAIHALVGPNGAGKSSLLSAVIGEIPFTGRVLCHFRGSGRVGYVPQSFPVDPTLPLTVAEFLALSRQRFPVCLGVRAATRAIAADLLDRVGLPGFAARRLAALSGGELRRVLLADAIHPDPELLLLDEPAAGLDAAGLTRLESLLRALRDERGVTVLLVSHDDAQVARLADAVTHLDRGAR